ncbi:MAG: InlB B-repeat-containing protein [Chitinispirillales bacterium]|nr:InlB B-repeat-containing protein [Chitinispirillales bacterium]
MQNKGKFLKAAALAIAALCVTGNAANHDQSYYATTDNGYTNYSYTCTDSAEIEAYLVGSGGGGQGGHHWHPFGKDYKGTGSSGGGGSATYAKFNVKGNSAISISVGGLGTGGAYNSSNGSNFAAGYAGNSGKETKITVDGITITANGGKGGGADNRNDLENCGGAGGTTSDNPNTSRITKANWQSVEGGRGAKGRKDHDHGKSSLGGNAGTLTEGSYSPGGLGGRKSDRQAATGGGGYGEFYNKGGKGSDGGHGVARIIVTYFWTVTLNVNGTGGSLTSSSQIKGIRDNSTITTLPGNPTRPGYTFGGWYKESGCSNQWIFSSDKVTANTTLYAKWTPETYTIKYEMYDGTYEDGNPNPASYTYESPTITLKSPTKIGYTFGGWFDNAEFSGSPVMEIPNKSIGSREYWAKWIPIPCKVTFNSQGGTTTPPPVTVNYYELLGKLAANPEKEDNVFFGWFKDVDGKYPWNFSTDRVVQDITLYAVYGGDRVGLSEIEYVYDNTEKTLGTVELLSGGTWVKLYEKVNFDAKYQNNVNAGTATATITGKDEYEYLGERELNFTIAKRKISINWYNTTLLWNGQQQAPTPISSDSRFLIDVKPETRQANIGSYNAEAVSPDTNIILTGNIAQYTVNPKVILVTWQNTTFTYNGEQQVPTAVSTDPAFPVKAAPYFESINVGTYYAEAILTTPNANITLTGNTTPYVIVKKDIKVEWENTGPFVYNKMVQAPTAKIKTGEEKYDTLSLLVYGGQAAVGVYDGLYKASVEIESQAIRNNFVLTNNTIAYEIVKKPLNVALTKKKYEEDPEDDEKEITDVVSVKRSGIDSVGSVFDILKTMIGYSGFATDTTTGETDNETNSFTSGEPKFEITPRENSQASRSVRDGNALTVHDYLQNGEYNVAVKVSDIIAQNYKPEDGQITLKVSDLIVTFTTDLREGQTAIAKPQKSDRKYGIILEKAVVSQSAKFIVKTPESAQVNLVVYDNTGNVVFESKSRNDKDILWNLTNNANRNVANGVYLIIAEAKSASGKTYKYSTKLGVRR